jgi:hypothetical protein
VTVLGVVAVERAYYHCRHCHRGHCPRDAQLGLSAADLSPGAEQVCALAGALGSYAEAAAKVLPRLTGLRLSESTVERATERAGRRVGDRLAAGEVFGPAEDWDWQPDAEGKTCAYVAADLFGLGMQGPGGAKAEGRMAPVAMVYNPGVGGQVRYLSGLAGGLAALGEPLRRQAGHVGLARAERWVALSDGGSGIEDFLRTNFPLVEAVILDFWHAAEHLATWLRTLDPDDPAAVERALGHWCHRLKHEGGRAVLAAVEAFDGACRPTARAAQQDLLVYLRNQVHRMDYPTYVAKGWQIGSGPVEAACKLVGARLKGTGMRWGEPGADAVCHLRALFRSESSQWDAFWQMSRAA